MRPHLTRSQPRLPGALYKEVVVPMARNTPSLRPKPGHRRSPRPVLGRDASRKSFAARVLADDLPVAPRLLPWSPLEGQPMTRSLRPIAARLMTLMAAALPVATAHAQDASEPVISSASRYGQSTYEAP